MGEQKAGDERMAGRHCEAAPIFLIDLRSVNFEGEHGTCGGYPTLIEHCCNYFEAALVLRFMNLVLREIIFYFQNFRWESTSNDAAHIMGANEVMKEQIVFIGAQVVIKSFVADCWRAEGIELQGVSEFVASGALYGLERCGWPANASIQRGVVGREF